VDPNQVSNINDRNYCEMNFNNNLLACCGWQQLYFQSNALACCVGGTVNTLHTTCTLSDTVSGGGSSHAVASGSVTDGYSCTAHCDDFCAAAGGGQSQTDCTDTCYTACQEEYGQTEL